MFLSDSALRRIAAETGDVWPEHLWRHDTATPGPTGVLAQLLHTVTLRFNDNAALLDQILATLGKQAGSLREATARHASIPPSGLDRTATDLLDQIGRRVLLEQLLLDAYDAWQTHRQPERGKDEQHLLLRPGDPPLASQRCAAATSPRGWCPRTPKPPPRSASPTPHDWSARSPNTATDGNRPPTATRSTAASVAGSATNCHPTTTS